MYKHMNTLKRVGKILAEFLTALAVLTVPIAMWILWEVSGG